MTDRSRAAGDTLELLGLVGSISLASVKWLGGSLASAPTTSSAVEATRLIGEDAARLVRVSGRIDELGAVNMAVVGHYDGLLDDFESRALARSWGEGLVKVYIAESLLRDFCGLLADGLPEGEQSPVRDLLASSDAAGWMHQEVAGATEGDPVLASRLALWGRRLVGEALGVVQSLMERPAIARLLAVPEGGRDQAWVFAQLTAEHTRRMGRLSLAA